MRKSKLLFIVAILVVTITNLKCTKEAFNLQKPPQEVLSKNAQDYSERLQAIRKNFYELKLDEKFKAKVKQDVIWTPDWEHPTSQVISDTVSYVFYPMKGHYEKGKLNGEVKTYGAKFYLIVKNEHEFFKGVYLNEQKEGSADEKKEVALQNFTGKLLLTNLQSKQTFLIKYRDGKVLDNLTQAQKIASAKQMAVKGTVSYWQTECHTELRYCMYASDGYSQCGGMIDIIVSYYCQWPSSHCGVSYYMVDYSEETFCENYWFPDPPQEPVDPGNGGTGNDGDPGIINSNDVSESEYYDDGKPKIADIKKYTKCFNDGKQAQSYTMTIYVDQPVSGQSDWFKVVTPTGGVTTNPFGVPTGVVFTTPGGTTFDVGHTFVTFEKNNTDGTNVRQTIGFYPSGNPIVSKGAMENNSLHEADVSYTMNVTQANFNAALAKVEDDFANKKYILTNLNGDEYNCTDAGISWMNTGGANFLNSSSGLFRNTPGNFGQVLRAKSGAYTNPTSGIQGKGECN